MDNLLSKIVDNIPRFDQFLGGGSEADEEYYYQEQEEQDDQQGQDETELGRDKSFDEEIYIHHLKQKLIDTFKQDEGKKILLIDKRLYSIFDMVVRARRLNETKNFDFQQEAGIEKINFLTMDQIGEKCGRIYFFIYPDLNLISKITSIILSDQQKNEQRKYCCIMVPRISSICQQKLQGVMSNIVLKSFNFDLIPLGQDLYSLEIQNPLQEIYFEKEQSVFQLVADSLLRIQYLCGTTNNIYGIGNAAKGVQQVLNNKKKQNLIQEDPVDYKTLESIIIIDRTVDLRTPLYTPITYQALLDEIIGINMNSMQVKKKIVDCTSKDDTTKKQIFVNPNTDAVFASISNKTIESGMDILKQKRRNYLELLEKYRLTANTLSQEEHDQIIKRQRDGEFQKLETHSLLISYLNEVSKYGRHAKLEAQIILPADPNDISEVVENLESLILFEYPVEEVLRLFCLLCQVQCGLKEKVYDSLRKLIIQQYGIQHLATLNRLEQLGLIKKFKQSSSKDEWANISTKLVLINEEVDLQNPNDISYVYSASAPLSVRLVEQTFKKGQWREIEKELKIIGNYFMPKEINPRDGNKKRKLVVVYYVGGVTYGEVAALRLLGQIYNKEIVICTTNIINSKSIFKACMAGFAELV